MTQLQRNVTFHDLKSRQEIQEEKRSNSEGIVIALSIAVVILASAVIIYYWYRSKQKPYLAYNKLSTRTESTVHTHQKPKLTLALPQISVSGLEEKYKNSQDHFLSVEEQEKINVSPPTPSTPQTPLTPLAPLPDIPKIRKIPLSKSISLPAKSVFSSKDINADGLWRNAVKKATNTQFLHTHPKQSKRISYCASGKIKFSLIYDSQNQKELTLKVCLY
jgi:hypothetical protein